MWTLNMMSMNVGVRTVHATMWRYWDRDTVEILPGLNLLSAAVIFQSDYWANFPGFRAKWTEIPDYGE